MISCKNTKEKKKSMTKGHEWPAMWGLNTRKINSEICLIKLCDMLLWCEQWVNETNNCMERKKGPLGQVSTKTKFNTIKWPLKNFEKK